MKKDSARVFSARRIRKISRGDSQNGEHFYTFQGLWQYKEKFDPLWEPKYQASPGGIMLPRILANIAFLITRNIEGDGL